MVSVNDVLDRINNQENEKYIINAANLAVAIDKIKPGFKRISEMVQKDEEKLKNAELKDPEQADILRHVMKAENNEGRLRDATVKLEENSEFYSAYINLLDENGLGEIRLMPHQQVIELGEKISQRIQERELAEVGLNADDLKDIVPTETRKQIRFNNH